MNSFEARRIIEALRSGVPSKEVGRFFSDSRKNTLSIVRNNFDKVISENDSVSLIILGKYGEGKTHMLNTIYNLAHENNMVVSFLSLSKETPLNNLVTIYQKLLSSTYLPNRKQPGFIGEFDEKMLDGDFVNDLCNYVRDELVCDKLYYLLKTYQKEDDSEKKYLLQSDLLGNFMKVSDLKRFYKSRYEKPMKLNESFVKSRHITDYISFMSYLFSKMGYNGWVILFDEAELLGRFARKSRFKAYKNMYYFLKPDKSLRTVYSVFAFTESYIEEVIEAKNDYETINDVYPDDYETIRYVLNRIIRAHRLPSLNKEEIRGVLMGIVELHEQAYNWKSNISLDQLISKCEKSGFLLRTKLRAAIEYLDQLYQYGDLAEISAGELKSESYDEDISFEEVKE